MLEEENRREIIEKFITICLPVSVTPRVNVKPAKVEHCGKPIIVPSKHTPCCKTHESNTCEFTIIQKMKIEIPVEFDANTKIDDPFVDCEFKKDFDDDKFDQDKNSIL